MGTSRTVAQFGRKLEKAGNTLQTSQHKAVNSAAAAAKRTILIAGRADSGGDLNLSRWHSGKGIKIGTSYKFIAPNAARLVPTPRGIWQMLEHGAAPHVVVPGATSRSRRRNQQIKAARVKGFTEWSTLGASTIADARRGSAAGRVLAWDGNVAAFIEHPGTRGKRTWTKGVTAAKPVAVSSYRTSVFNDFEEIFTF